MIFKKNYDFLKMLLISWRVLLICPDAILADVYQYIDIEHELDVWISR